MTGSIFVSKGAGTREAQSGASQKPDTYGCVMSVKLLKGPWMRCLSSCAQRMPPAMVGMFLCTGENPGDRNNYTEEKVQLPAPSAAGEFFLVIPTLLHQFPDWHRPGPTPSQMPD